MKKNILKLLLITLAITTMLFMGGCGSDKPVDENINPTPTQSADLIEPTGISTTNIDTDPDTDTENKKDNTDNAPNNIDEDENKNKESLSETDKDTDAESEVKNDLVKYENKDNKISFKVPSSWSKIDVEESTVAFVISMNEDETFATNVNLMIQDLSKYDMSLDDYSKLSYTQLEEFEGYKSIDKKAITIDGLKGEYTEFTFNNNGIELHICQMWTVEDDKAYIFTFVATEEEFAKELESFNDLIKTVEIEADKETEVEINDDLVKYENKDNKISFKVPSSWSKVDVEESTVAFVISMNEDETFATNVNLMIQDLSKYDMSLDDYSKLSYTQLEEFEGYKSIDKKAITIDGLKGEYTEYTFNNNGIELYICQMWTVEDDKAYVFTFGATEEEFTKGLESFNDLIKTVEIG